MTAESEKILPVDDHIRLLVFGEAHKTPCDTCKADELEHALPPWYDEAKYKRGQAYIKRNMIGQTTAIVCGVITVFAIPTALTILMKTHRSSTNYTAYRRYLSTIMHFNSWYNNELKPGTDAWRSLCAVRSRHIKWSNVSKLRKDGHISQRDLVLTLNAFGGLSLARPQLLGMDHDRADQDDYSHFWRTIGYMLGIEDRYNVFRPSLDESVQVIEAIIEGIYKPLMQNPPEYFYHMSTAFLQGLWYFDPTLSEGAMYYFAYRLLGIEGFEYSTKKILPKPANQKKNTNKQVTPKSAKQKKNTIDYKKGLGYSEYEGKNSHSLVTGDRFYTSLGLYNRFMLFLMVFLFENVFNTFVGRIFGLLKLFASITFAKYLPILFIFRYGTLKGAYIDMFAEDVKMDTRVKTNQQMLEERNY